MQHGSLCKIDIVSISARSKVVLQVTRPSSAAGQEQQHLRLEAPGAVGPQAKQRRKQHGGEVVAAGSRAEQRHVQR